MGTSTFPMIPTLTILCVLSISTIPNLVLSFPIAPSISTMRTQRGRAVVGRQYCTSPHPSYCSYSTSLRSTEQEEETITSTTEKSVDSEASTRIFVERPIIHWTVPIQKIGWQDEDTGIWYDEDGPRKGPPQNYWRQNLDQRAYQLDMDLVTQALRDESDGGIDTKLDGASKEVEGKNSVRRPSRHRNLLGKWAPIYFAGAKVATSSPNDSKPADDNDSVGWTIEVPLTIEIFRTAGRKLAPKNHYGIFDASLAEGEEITMKTSDGAIDITVGANEANEPVAFGKVTVAGSDRALQLGGVTYVSDYLLVQRNGEGRLSDIWLRCDDAYLGQNVEE